ncbi:MAG: NAD(P)-dependent oxidoreductase [Candidatus Diapherotrites archaeon]|nr:NAD(P)-dependent oxidoreductase [Candidatus Diapherotrites archaeon]
MRIGVTGAGGYVGPRLIQKLEGHEVVACDDGLKQKVGKVGDVEIAQADIRDVKRIEELFRDTDVIVHLAAVTGMDACNSSPNTAFEVDANGTNNVAWVCRQYGIPLVFASSMAVFGDSPSFPISEETPMKPTHIYGFLKYAGGKAIEVMSEDSFPAIVLIKSNVYGVYEVDGKEMLKPTAVNKFYDLARQKREITIYTPGTQARNFLYIDDAVQAYIKAAEAAAKRGPGADYMALAAEEDCTVKHMAELVQAASEEELGYRPEIKLTENPRKNEPATDQFDVDISKIKRELGYRPEYPLERGVRELFRK